jgi:putative ABC transport system substrate-binding protein
MNRRAFIGTLACGLLAAPLAAEAQQAGKVAKIGVLEFGGSTNSAFGQQLRELGYIEGQNLILEHRFAEGRAERLPDLAAELVRLKVDVIVAGGTPPPLAAKHATSTIPIVMAAAGDPVRTGLVANLARPGGNVTGLLKQALVAENPHDHGGNDQREEHAKPPEAIRAHHAPPPLRDYHRERAASLEPR